MPPRLVRKAAQYIPPRGSPRCPGAGRVPGSGTGRAGSHQYQRARKEARRFAAGAVPALCRSRSAAGSGDGGSVPAVQRHPQGSGRQAVEAIEAVALCAGDARLRIAAQRHLPPDVRLAHHGLRAEGQRVAQGGNGNAGAAARVAGSAGRRVAARAAGPEDLGVAAWRGHAGGAGIAHRPRPAASAARNWSRISCRRRSSRSPSRSKAAAERETR